MSSYKPLEQFTFTPCHPLRLAASSNSESLLGLLQPTAAPQGLMCHESTGIKLGNQQATSLRSTQTLDAFRDHLNSNEWSLSTWITAPVPPADEIPSLQPIWTFGSGQVSRMLPTDGGCDGFSLMVAQFGANLVVAFEDATHSCRMIRIGQYESQHNVFVFLTITTSGSTTNLFMQGKLIMENIPYSADLTRLPMNQTMQLFPQIDANSDNNASAATL
ncbi:hypothetical protein FisN_24Hu248 [Fistulifera solaris]|uniref:Uncharacterized protein n=1 Tax=Fistulifera solaris TaxID=1519565 RepID=A0A1Z5K2V9_FISSO|nr:hypothetical protein FisN_24Hu248 [Fistulifera solaris]|eukprot:GAX20502.1 hypothetical protein FisN_24Hu248 [Fistulifera solaris]